MFFFFFCFGIGELGLGVKIPWIRIQGLAGLWCLWVWQDGVWVLGLDGMDGGGCLFAFIPTGWMAGEDMRPYPPPKE